METTARVSVHSDSQTGAAVTLQPKVVVVMPAYNAARTLRMTYADLPHGSYDKVILVDDGSTDETVRIARELGLTVFVHTGNYGYGANQKTCYREALRAGADVVVMVHLDYQYDPRLLPTLVQPIVDGTGRCRPRIATDGRASRSSRNAVVEVRGKPRSYRARKPHIRPEVVGIPHRATGPTVGPPSSR